MKRSNPLYNSRMDVFFDRLDTMHNLFGRGTRGETVLRENGQEVILPADSDNFHGEVIAKLQYGTSTRKFRVVNGTLFYCGHQSKLDNSFRY
jgi:hypothetical protein